MEIKKREVYKVIIFEPAKSRIANNQCPGCGLNKDLWKRRKDWRCCSAKCTEIFGENYIIYGWPEMRMKAIKRDNFACVKCGDSRKEVEVIIKYKRIKDWRAEKYVYEDAERKEVRSNFIGDHIIPIALGGDEWDLENIQTLCLACNKTKTANDLKEIARFRKYGIINDTQKTL